MAVLPALKTVTLTIDDLQVTAREGDTVLEAALAAGIDVPRLCHDPRLKPVGACRLCIVDIAGKPGLMTACTLEVEDGMVVQTETDELAETRRSVLELILGDHRVSCPTCDKNRRLRSQWTTPIGYGADQYAFGAYQPSPQGPQRSRPATRRSLSILEL